MRPDTGWLRDRSLLDYTGLEFEAFADSTVATQVAAARAVFRAGAHTTIVTDNNGADWVTFSAPYLDDTVDVAVLEVDDIVVVVTLTVGVGERAAVSGAIWLDVLSATRPS